MADSKSVEANQFVIRLKAHGSENDLCDLKEVYGEYKSILSGLDPKDRGLFSLNVLCILCRNLESVIAWKEKICNKSLLELSIECLRQTRVLNSPEQVKRLACIYNINRYIVRQNVHLPPELILKLSYMPFEVTGEDLLREYYKTYWSILADRILYIEKLKSQHLSITKLLPKLTEDIKTVFTLYTSLQICLNILAFVIKKLYILYSDVCPKDLNGVYRNLFECIMKKDDLKSMKMISVGEAFDVYIKFNDCLYVIVENDLKVHFKESPYDYIVRSMITLLGNNPDIYNCFQTVYVNCFCCIFKRNVDSSYLETVLENLCTSCDTAEKLGYSKAIYQTYPHLALLLRLYIEYNITSNSGELKDVFNVSIQEKCLKIMLYLLKKLMKTQQLSKCDGCSLISGHHDALRLSFSSKQMIASSVKNNMDLTNILPVYYNVVEEQYKVLTELNKLGCSNHRKCLNKLQTDVHNTAIMLSKAKSYQYSTKLLNIYLKNEIRNVRNDSELKNIARALYNKGIIELDYNLYDDAMRSAYLSLVFSGEQGMKLDKHMSLIMDIKNKALKKSEGKEDTDEAMQMVTVLTACKTLAVTNDYGNLKPYLSTLKFSKLLKHEFSIYVKLWPSIAPIAGVWRSLYELVRKEHDSWIQVESGETLSRTLYEVMLETLTVVRLINSDHYKSIVTQVLKTFDSEPPISVEDKVVQATLLFLQSEYDIADATQKYGWKFSESIIDPDQAQLMRTLPLEQQALTSAIKAVHVWTEILPKLKTVALSPLLHHGLQFAGLFAQQFLYMRRWEYGLQLAHICCELAHIVEDHVLYLRYAGALLSRARSQSKPLTLVMARAQKFWCDLICNPDTLDAALVYACDLAMYYERCGSKELVARLLQFVEARILEASVKQPELNLKLAMGRLLEARALCTCGGGQSFLSAVNTVQKHYISVVLNPEFKWCSRRQRAMAVKLAICEGGVMACRGAKALRLWRRARGTASGTVSQASALFAATLYATLTDGHQEDAQVKVDNRLKHILGLQPTNDIQPHCQQPHKLAPFSPKQEQLETMRENMIFKKVETSPSLPCVTIPAFKMPEFLNHESSCGCYACDAPYSFILAYQTCVLEASIYFRSKESKIARDYFAGATKALALCEAKLDKALRKRASIFQEYVVDIVRDDHVEEIRRIEVEMLMEATCFELCELNKSNFQAVNDNLVRIYEIIQEHKLDPYLENEFNNLLIATARIKAVSKKQAEVDLEEEFEALKISPNTELKTPESKFVPEKKTNKVVKGDEVPSFKRKVIKLNLDDESEEETVKEVKETKRQQFKMPVPAIKKPVLETVTPRPKTRPKVLITQSTADDSSEASEQFFTPRSSPPKEQFFTPMSSVKTYSRKKGLIAKKLENEFSTPKAEDDKENKIMERRGRSTRSNKLSHR